MQRSSEGRKKRRTGSEEAEKEEEHLSFTRLI